MSANHRQGCHIVRTAGNAVAKRPDRDIARNKYSGPEHFPQYHPEHDPEYCPENDPESGPDSNPEQ